MTPILVASPAHRLCASIPIAANRAGETGILDLGYGVDVASQREEIASLRLHSRNSDQWGVRWDCLESPGRCLERLQSLLGDARVPILILGGIAAEELTVATARQQTKHLADRVLLEVTTLEQARWAEQTGFDGIIVRGFEAGGRVSFETTFCLLQRLSEKIGIPFWVHGGIGPDTAASALLAGAAGIVLCEQLWLASESPFSDAERKEISRANDTLIVGDHNQAHRFLGTADRKGVSFLDRAIAAREDWRSLLLDALAAGTLIPVGQDVLLAERLAVRHTNVAGIIKAYRLRSRENFKMSSRNEVLAPAAPLAEALGIKYPIIQGPVAGITEAPSFCRLVSDAGALPLLALSGQNVDEAKHLLDGTAKAMGEQPFGVAIPYSSTVELRERYFEQINATKPPVVVIDGRDVEKLDSLEKGGISVYLHVHTLELLESLLKSGHKRFIIEGNECGGPLGPRSSFSLWQCAIDSILAAKIDKPENYHLIFAGPIHDSLSAAMTAAAVAPLSARGMKVGVQVGSAYFFTPQAVESGIITQEFHDAILHCREIAHLPLGDEITIRCIPTPFVDEFNNRRADLIREGKSIAQIAEDLNRLAHERLTLAAKGVLKGASADVPTQRRLGLYRVGEVAVLRNKSINIRELHEEISQESVVLLERLASQRLPWHPEDRPARPKSEDIAIVGMSCMFPKADDMRKYWENICRTIDAVEEVDPERWNPEDYFDSDRLAKDRVYSKWGGFLNKVTFDPMKWRIPPAALKAIEPIQLLALDIAFRAMNDAGYDKREFPRERTGVLFACAGSHDLGSAYAFRTMMRQYLPKVEGLTDEAREVLEQKLTTVLPEWTEDSFPGFLLNVVAGRV
ncbi:nitronate monooxygenase, partial [bacterium]|nr:nitronate monooxygenase [bacterium]